jgi:predicted transcriptional regulator
MRTHESRVEDVMTPDVIAVAPNTSLAALVQLFLHHDIAGAPVVDEEGKPVGVVSASDLLDVTRRSGQVGVPRYYRLWNGHIRAVGITDEGSNHVMGIVSDVMTPSVVAIDRRSTVREAAQLMARVDVHRLVVTEAGRACGVLTTMDCLKVLAS